MKSYKNRIFNILVCFLILSFLPMMALAAPGDGGQDPKTMVGNLREWATGFFDEFVLLMCVVVAVIYLSGVASSGMKAKGIGAVGIILGAVFIFYGLPWLAQNLF